MLPLAPKLQRKAHLLPVEMLCGKVLQLARRAKLL
jgi:hypothetical protein